MTVEFKMYEDSKHEWLLNFPEIQRWLKEIPSESTRYEYLCILSKWINHKKGMNPTELIAEAIERRKSGDSEVESLIHQEILGYYDQLFETVSPRTKMKISSGTARREYSVIRSFYRYNGIELPKFSRRVKAQTFVEHEKGYVPAPEETAKMIDYAKSIRDKGVIAFIASSGQRAGVLTALKYGHVRPQLEEGKKSIIFNVPKVLLDGKGINVNKNRTKYAFGINEQTAQYIRDMIAERIRDGEPIDDDSWLFRSYVRTYVWKGPNPVRVRKDERGDALTVEAIADIVEGAAVSAGLQKPRSQLRKGERAKIHPHSLRRYFKKQGSKGIREARELMLIEFFMSHKIPELQKAYPAVDFDDPDVVRGFYEQIEPSLSWIPKPISEVERRKQAILDSAKLFMAPEKFAILQNLMAHARTIEEVDEGVEAFKEGEIKAPRIERRMVVAKKVEKEETEEDCQQIIDENDLKAYLSRGWRYVATLPSGKIIVDNQK